MSKGTLQKSADRYGAEKDTGQVVDLDAVCARVMRGMTADKYKQPSVDTASPAGAALDAFAFSVMPESIQIIDLLSGAKAGYLGAWVQTLALTSGWLESARLPQTAGFTGKMAVASTKTKQESGEDAAIASFLEELYRLADAGRVRSASVRAIDFIDRLLNKGEFPACDELLRRVNLSRMPSALRRAFLMVTYPAKGDLPSRTVLYDEALRILTEERGAETARMMLRTLV